jgi:alanine racemase
MSEHGSSDGSASSRQRLAARPAWRELDLDALGSNLAEARRRAGPGTRLIASIKADAYGHGVVAVARRLSELGVVRGRAGTRLGDIAHRAL